MPVKIHTDLARFFRGENREVLLRRMAKFWPALSLVLTAIARATKRAALRAAAAASSHGSINAASRRPADTLANAFSPFARTDHVAFTDS